MGRWLRRGGADGRWMGKPDLFGRITVHADGCREPGGRSRPILLRRIRRVLHSPEPLIHPPDDVLQAFDAVPRLARSRKLVVFARESDHHGRDPPVLQRAEHLLAAVSGRRAVVLIPSTSI